MTPLWIIVLTYNSGPDIEQCIRSIERTDNVHILAIDNNSSDDTVSVLERLYNEGILSILKRRASNSGFSRAINEALIETPLDSDVLLLNPDAVLEPGSLAILRETARDRPLAGILSPLVYSANSVKITSAGKQPTLFAMFAHYVGLSRLCRNTKLCRGRNLYVDGKLEPIEQVGWVAGACMYIKRSTLESIGLLSERWFMYAEDTDYCYRAKENGLEVLLVTEARCFHALGQSVQRSPSNTLNVMWPRSLTDYYKITFKPRVVTFFLWRAVFSLGLFSRAWLLMLRALVKDDETVRHQSRRFAKFAGAVWSTNNDE